MNDRTATLFVVSASLLLAACRPSPPPPTPTAAPPRIDVVELSGTEALRQMAEGRFTSHELAQAYLDRIAEVDDSGPTLNAVIELNPEALAEALALDIERKAPELE